MKVLLALLACVIAATGADISGRVVGGSAATIEAIPYQLSVWVKETFKCGGVIISTKAALTSARCVDGETASTITVNGGTEHRNKKGSLQKVSSIVAHPSYSRTTWDYDIAILKLASAFKLGPNIGVATLPSDGETVAVGSLATVSGWGITTIGGTEYAGRLQVATMPVVATSVCTTALSRINKITDRMLCAGYTTGGKDICTGDHGGPLVYAKKLIGIVSWGGGCGAVGKPAVFTRIAALRSWISTKAGV
ncbi:trypsin-1-like [Athalia rosae]|uniref:trypsin-1-like n=1 Tax=Athalia rosae TaxID=37344 RepID=UPI00203326B3|nr:trypsin-1-like [Athalia rosae]